MTANTTRPPTIYDVAQAAGVAPSTVSRALAKPGRVSFATAERVRRTVAELGYRAKAQTRTAPGSDTALIMLVVSDASNPFFTDITRGAQRAATDAGYSLLLSDTRESAALERELLDRAVPTMAGVVLATSRMSDKSIRMIAKHGPVIVLNRAVIDLPCIVTDNVSGVRRVVEHLAELGHTRVAYLAGPERSWSDGVRWEALRQATAALGMTACRIGPLEPTLAGGARALDPFQRHAATAAVAYNDLMAIGFSRGLTARGVRVPEEVSVVGFDNSPLAQLVTPGLTTVASPLCEMGRTAVGNLIALARGARHRGDEPLNLPMRLVIRDSTATAVPRRRCRAAR